MCSPFFGCGRLWFYNLMLRFFLKCKLTFVYDLKRWFHRRTWMVSWSLPWSDQRAYILFSGTCLCSKVTVLNPVFQQMLKILRNYGYPKALRGCSTWKIPSWSFLEQILRQSLERCHCLSELGFQKCWLPNYNVFYTNYLSSQLMCFLFPLAKNKKKLSSYSSLPKDHAQSQYCTN